VLTGERLRVRNPGTIAARTEAISRGLFILTLLATGAAAVVLTRDW
jgi:hypothetical protein